MKIFFILIIGLFAQTIAIAQTTVHPNAHAHNDYEHPHPLKDALQNGFLSVEADVHLRAGKLVVAHAFSTSRSPTLEELYVQPLDSLVKKCASAYCGDKHTFYLMIDIKTDGEETYQELKKLFEKYPALRCDDRCVVKIFISGNRPAQTVMRDGGELMSLDGRPGDIGKRISPLLMPVISDTYSKWSTWSGRAKPTEKDLQRIQSLAQRVHAEGKKLRLWATPDNELVWEALLNAGVDLINTDHLEELNAFLRKKNL